MKGNIFHKIYISFCVAIMTEEMLGSWNYTFDQQPGLNWMNRKFSMYNSHFSLLFVSLPISLISFTYILIDCLTYLLNGPIELEKPSAKLSLLVLIFPLCFCTLTIYKSGFMNDMYFTKTISRGAVNKEIFWIVLMALLYLWLPNVKLPSVCSTLFADI